MNNRKAGRLQAADTAKKENEAADTAKKENASSEHRAKNIVMDLC